MAWILLPHLTACRAGDAIMLLDLRQDRYFRVPPTVATAVEQWLREGEGPLPPKFAELLVRNAILRPGEVVSAHHVPVSVPSTLADSVDMPALGGREFSSIAGRLLGTWTALRTRRLRTLLVDRQKWRAVQSTGEELPGGLIASYHRARRLVPMRKNCLLDSLALDRWLDVRGSKRTLVFGVTTEPFLAHCWLQTEQRLLNDSYDHVRRYTPILAI